MSPAGSGRAETFWRFFRLFKELFIARNVAIVVLLIGIGLVGLFGGWDKATADADAKALPTVAPGQAVTAAPFTLTVQKVSWAESLGTTFPDEPDARYLFLTADVTNADSRFVETSIGAQHLLDQALSLSVPGLLRAQFAKPSADEVQYPATIYRGDDSLPMQAAQPGVTARLVYVWRQKATEQPPTKATITFRRFTWRVSRLDGHSDWFDPTDLSTMTVPVVEVAAK